MRVVGYIRESPAVDDVEPAFVQGESLRRWVRETGHNLVSICQDVRQEGQALQRDGYQAMLGILVSEGADGVVVPDLDTLSPDLMTQEVMLWDLARRGVPVMTADAADHRELLSPGKERLLIRDVLARIDRYAEWGHAVQLEPAEDRDEEQDEVIVQLIPASDA